MFLSAVACSKKEQAVVAITGPVEASLVRVSDDACELRMTRPKPLTLPVQRRCEADELVADSTGQRLAFGPKGGKHRLIYFGGRNRNFEAPAPIEGTIDWNKLPVLADALDGIFRDALDREEEMRADGGEPKQKDFGDDIILEIVETKKATTVLDGTKDAPFRADSATYTGLWHRGFLHADEADRDAVRKHLVDAIKSAKPRPSVIARAIREVDLSGAAYDAILAARLRELVGKKAPDATERAVLSVLFRRTANPSLACQFLDGWKWDSASGTASADDAGAALSVIAAAKAPCPAMRALFDEAVKTPAVGVCTEKTWFCPDSDDVNVPRTRCLESTYVDRAKIMATRSYAQLQAAIGTNEKLFLPALVLARAGAGPLSSDGEKIVARQSYAWKKSGLAPCKASAAGKVCSPNWDFVHPAELCDPRSAIPIGSHEGVLRYDDAARQRWFEGG